MLPNGEVITTFDFGSQNKSTVQHVVHICFVNNQWIFGSLCPLPLTSKVFELWAKLVSVLTEFHSRGQSQML